MKKLHRIIPILLALVMVFSLCACGKTTQPDAETGALVSPVYPSMAPQPDQADYLKENGSIGIKEIRGLLGIKKGQADALITRLMMQCRVVTGDILRVFRGPDLHYSTKR